MRVMTPATSAGSATETQELPYYSDNSLHASGQQEVLRKRRAIMTAKFLKSTLNQKPPVPNPKPQAPKL